jgi:hypothetical protein
MFRFGIASVALGLVVVSSADTGPVTLKKDPAFQTPVTLNTKNEPISDALKDIAGQAGVGLQCETAIDDLKVTVFATKVPAGLLLDKIASVLDCGWTRDNKMNILAIPRAEQQARSDFLDQEDQVIRAAAEKEARSMATSAADASSFEEFEQQFNSSNTSLPGPAPKIPGELPVLRRVGMQSVMASPATYAMGLMMSKWSDADWNSFWGGDVAYTSFTRPNISQDPSQVQSNVAEPPMWVFFRYDAYGGHTLEMAQPPQGRIPHMPNMDEDELSGPLGQTTFGKAVLAWPDITEGDKDEAFKAPIHQIGASAATQNEYMPVPDVGMSDQLEKLSQASDIPIVADGFRAPEPDRVHGGTTNAWLKSLQSVDKAYVRIEDGVAMVRHARFWRLRESEIPEEAIAPMVQRTDPLTIMDYAQFVAGLTPAQQATLSAPKPPILGFPLEPLQYCLPGVAFLGTFTTPPTPGQAVPFGSLSAAQQNLFTAAVMEGSFDGANWMGAGPGFDSSRYAFIFKNMPVTVNGRVVSGVNLFFGQSEQDGISYNVPLNLSGQ